MFSDAHSIASLDPALWSAMRSEFQRQEEGIELIASENYASPAVLAAQGSVLTNKYAEGYPGKRYYGGCEFVDVAESLAIERVKRIFGAEYANVQPHSGSQANQAVYMAMAQRGDAILGMSLAHGGHLTHGAAVNTSGKLYRSVAYGLNAKEEIDYEQVRSLAEEFNPRMIVAGASAYALRIDWQKFRDIADEVGALFMVDMAHYAGLVAAGLYPSPVGIADFVTSTTHKTLRGPRGGVILAGAEHEKAFVTSGIRIGSPAMTTRGFRDAEAAQVANFIADVLEARGDAAAATRIGAGVKALCAKFPVYGPAMRASYGMAENRGQTPNHATAEPQSLPN